MTPEVGCECFATVETTARGVEVERKVARLATYLQGYGDGHHKTGIAVLQRFREDSVVTSARVASTTRPPPEQIEHITTLIPDEWLEPSGGSAHGGRPIRDRLRRRRADHARRGSRRARAHRHGLPLALKNQGVMTVRLTGSAAACLL